MANLSYDLDDLKNAKKAIKGLKDELDACNTALNNDLTELKKGWDTDAGKKFFKDHKDTWTVYVKKYVKKLNGLQSMLQAVITEYDKIDDEVSKL